MLILIKKIKYRAIKYMNLLKFRIIHKNIKYIYKSEMDIYKREMKAIMNNAESFSPKYLAHIQHSLMNQRIGTIDFMVAISMYHKDIDAYMDVITESFDDEAYIANLKEEEKEYLK